MEPPDPIPNSEVKRTCADGSVHLACESRSSPGFLPKTPAGFPAGVFLCAQAGLEEYPAKMARNLEASARGYGPLRRAVVRLDVPDLCIAWTTDPDRCIYRGR